MRFTKVFCSLVPLALVGTSSTVSRANNPIYIVTKNGVEGSFSGLLKLNMVSLRFYNTTSEHTFNVRYYRHSTGAFYRNDSIVCGEDGKTYYDLTYNLVIDNVVNEGGVDMDFRILDGEKNEVYNQPIFLTSTLTYSITSSNYKNKPFEILNTTFALSKDGCEQKEYYQFKNTVSEISIDKNNYLDLSELTFTYGKGEKLPNPMKNTYLEIFDPNKKLFPYISTRDSGGFLQVPLCLLQNKEEITFDLMNNALSFDPKKLEMCDYSAKLKGATFFYIPNDKLDGLLKSIVRIRLYNFGRNTVEVTIPLKFTLSKNVIGECVDSEYCVIGGIKS